MAKLREIIDSCHIKPGKKFKLKDHDPAWAGNPDVPKKERKEFAEHSLTQDVAELANAQELLYASDTWSLLIVLQAMDAAGKDGTIKHVMSGINPQGCQIYSFKQPTSEELDHNFLWRNMVCLPERGKIGIFNRSYYEEVLVVKVHPELLAAQRIPDAKVNDNFWKARYNDINHFEQHLARNGTRIVKFYLNLSKAEQRERFLARIENPDKHWKISPSDISERKYWDDYMQAYDECISETSTDWAPWYVIPADHKWVSRALIARILTHEIDSLNLTFPEVSPTKKKEIEAAKQLLETEEKNS
ncbi:MAG: polyphosphate kinase 2 family protein [Pirellulales bacterium]|nr:polyphosphate kinase 2 family protein [Pirellulales bacterium]